MGRDKNQDPTSNTQTYAPNLLGQQFTGEVETGNLPAEIEAMVVEMSIAQPDWGHMRLSNELQKNNIEVSPSEVRDIWDIWSLQTRELRLQAQIDGVRPIIEEEQATAKNGSTGVRKEVLSILLWGSLVCAGLAALAWALLRH